MKKIILSLIFLFALVACTEDGYLFEDSQEISGTKTLKYAGDGEYDVLGMGYDITGEYLHPSSVKGLIIDIDKYKQDYPRRLVTGTSGWGYDKMNYGYSAVDYVSNIAVNISAEFGINAGKIFSGTITQNPSFSGQGIYSSKHSYASLDIIRNKKYIYINDEIDRISNYISEEFEEDAARLTPERLIKRYGTHVLVDFTIGGRYKLTYKSVITNTKEVSKKRNTVKSGLGVTIKKIGLSVNTSSSVEANESLAKENRNQELYVMFYGGVGTNLVYDLEKGMPTAVDIAGWENKLELTNAVLTDINWEETYPIYEFISDPVKKEEVKNAVEKYIDDSAIKELEIVPFRSHYTVLNGNLFFLYNTLDNVQGWITQGAECFVFDEQIERTVPLYQYTLFGHRLYSTQESVSGWSKGGIVCYVYKDQVEGTVPLYQFAHPKGARIYSTSSRIEPGWIYEGIACYVYDLK